MLYYFNIIIILHEPRVKHFIGLLIDYGINSSVINYPYTIQAYDLPVLTNQYSKLALQRCEFINSTQFLSGLYLQFISTQLASLRNSLYNKGLF
jgi:hypothetical protein